MWTYFLPACDPFMQGRCEFHQVDNPAQVLLDRLGVFLACLEGVQQAYLLQVRPPDSHEGLALMVKCGDATVFERIRKAIPLLGWGLSPGDFPRFAVPLAQHPDFEIDLSKRLPPVYDHAIRPWFLPMHGHTAA